MYVGGRATYQGRAAASAYAHGQPHRRTLATSLATAHLTLQQGQPPLIIVKMERPSAYDTAASGSITWPPAHG